MKQDTHPPRAAGSAAAAIEVPVGALTAPLDWEALFGNDHPVELEVGTGKGRFLIESARTHPEVNFLGIERSLKWMRFGRGRMERVGLANVRLVRTEARHFIDRYVPDRSVRAIHIYFPDPWPKRRHERRRLFRPGIGASLARCIVPGGRLHLATDQEDYFAAMLAVLVGEPALERLRDGPGEEATQPQTHFEAKYVAEGRGIHRAEYRRVG
jgi:tRNA (guanine-N7-)-methyltransferase